MKTYISFLAVLLSIKAFTQNKNTSPIVGTWQFVSGTYKTNNNVVTRDSSTFAHYKVITPNWFMYSAFIKGADTLYASTAGTLTYNGKEMTHTAKYSSSKGRIGVTATYTVEVKGNLLYQKGKLGNTEVSEIWVKLY
jgi:GH43 family beta-xylosidase